MVFVHCAAKVCIDNAEVVDQIVGISWCQGTKVVAVYVFRFDPRPSHPVEKASDQGNILAFRDSLIAPGEFSSLV